MSRVRSDEEEERVASRRRKGTLERGTAEERRVLDNWKEIAQKEEDDYCAHMNKSNACMVGRSVPSTTVVTFAVHHDPTPHQPKTRNLEVNS